MQWECEDLINLPREGVQSALRSCKHGNKYSCALQGDKFLSWLRDYWLFEKDPARELWSSGLLPNVCWFLPTFRECLSVSSSRVTMSKT